MKNKIKAFIKENRTDIIALCCVFTLFVLLCIPIVREARAFSINMEQVEKIEVEPNEEISFVTGSSSSTTVIEPEESTDNDVEVSNGLEGEGSEGISFTGTSEERVESSSEESYIIPESDYYDIPLPVSIQDHIFAVCEEYGVDPTIVIAMIDHESEYNTSSIGDKGESFGLMQIQPKWHAKRMEELGCTDLLNPYHNITVGVDHLAHLINISGSVEWALMAYNGGPGMADRKMSQGELSNYAITVLSIKETLVKG